jgi:hypothetical protein
MGRFIELENLYRKFQKANTSQEIEFALLIEIVHAFSRLDLDK